MMTVVARTIFLVGAAMCGAVVQAGPDNPPPNRFLAGHSAHALKPVQSDPVDAAKKGRDDASSKVHEHVDSTQAAIRPVASFQEIMLAEVIPAATSLSDAGGDIDEACEACHKSCWYPPARQGGQ